MPIISLTDQTSPETIATSTAKTVSDTTIALSHEGVPRRTNQVCRG